MARQSRRSLARCFLAVTFCPWLGTSLAVAADLALQAGAARVEVTQASVTPAAPQKYGHQRAFVRAIVMDNGETRAALISIPGSDFDWPAISRRVAADLDIPASQVLVSATHSHSFNSTRSRIEKDPGALTDAAIDAVRQAESRLQPARLGYGAGESHLNVNRDFMNSAANRWEQSSNVAGPSEKTVTVLSFESLAGQPIAVHVSYAMHPVNAYALDVNSGDFPEAMSRHVEKAFGEEMIAAFSLGAAGDQNPLYLRLSTNAMATRSGNDITGFEMYREASEGPLRARDESGKAIVNTPVDPPVLDELLAFIDAEGQLLGEEVIRVMGNLRKVDHARIAGYTAKPECPARRRINGDKLDPATREGMAAIYEDIDPVAVPVGLLAVGPVALAYAGEEPYTRIARRVLDQAPLANTFFLSFTGEKGRTGYIPDDASFNHQTFQVLNSALKPGCAEDAIVDALVDFEFDYLNHRWRE